LPKNSQDDLGETVIQNDRTPTREFLLTMPTTLPGFNMDDKQWSKFSALHNSFLVSHCDRNTLGLSDGSRSLG
jgi:hypothetical protein